MSNLVRIDTISCCATEDGRAFLCEDGEIDEIGSLVDGSAVIRNYNEKLLLFNIEGRPYVIANEIGTNLYRIE